MFQSVFGKRTPSGPSVASIVVRQSAHASEEQTKLVSDAVDFVNAMTQDGLYLRGELPPNAMRVYHTDYYLAQVANGGHGQFVGNSGWNPPVIKDITEGLAAMNAEPYRAIFAELVRLIEGDKARAKVIADGSGFGEIDPAIKALDDRFFQHDVYTTFSPMIAHWLRSLPELEVVPDAIYTQRIEALCAANPQRAARIVLRKTQTLNANLDNPLWVAGRLLCVKAGRLPMRGIGGGDPTSKTPDGEQATGWHIHTGDGTKIMQIGRETTYLCDTYLQDGTKYTDELAAQMHADIQAGNLAALSNFGTMSQRAITTIPTRDIESAIEAAKATPIVRIAELLVSKLGTGETVKDVFAGVFHASGQWLWFVETEKRAALLGINDGHFNLNELQAPKTLSSASFDEVREVIARDPSGHA